MTSVYRFLLIVFACGVSVEPLLAQLQVEPVAGMVLRNRLGAGSARDENGAIVGEYLLTRKSAPLLGVRLGYPVTSRLTLAGAYATAWTAYTYSSSSSSSLARTPDYDVHLNLFSAQAMLRFTHRNARASLALSVGPALIVTGESPIDLDAGAWGGVVGVHAGYRLSQRVTLTLSPNAYFPKWAADSRKDVTLSAGLAVAPRRE